MSHLRTVAIVLGLLATTRAAGAQMNSHAASDDIARTMTPCLRALSPEQLQRVTLFLEADVAEGASRGVLPAGDLLVELVTARVRARLDAVPDSVPAGDALLAWHEVDRWLTVTLRRDGSIAWRPRGADSARVPTGGAAVLARALDELVAEGQQLFWPDGVAGDAVEFELHLHHPMVLTNGTAEPMTLRRATPLVTLPVPPMTPVRPDQPPRIAYPTGAQRGGAQGMVVLRFVVDESGRVDPASVRDVWPPDRPRLTGDLLRHYTAFRRAAERGLQSATYEPATVGGCPVRQVAQQAFEYGLRRP